MAQSYNFDSLSAGATGSFANGWVGTPTTAFSWRADNNGTPSGGTGPDVDHTLGTPLGIYMYTEASTPATQGDTAILESPNLNLSSFTNPGLKFWYHKVGSAMGDLYVDIFNGVSWDIAVDSIIGSTHAATNAPWLRHTIELTGYSGIIKMRFRAICGASWPGDMAIDDVALFELPPFDLQLGSAAIIPRRYYMYPVPQSTFIAFSGKLTNIGASALTTPTMKVSLGSWADSASVPTLAAGASATVSTGLLTPSPTGFHTALYESFAVENDTSLANNYDSLDFYITDSIYAIDDSLATNALGIGGGTPGILGQYFEVFATDTLTSVSFFLNAPTIGDTAWVTIHSYDTIPGGVIGTTDIFIIPSDTGAWYTLPLTCPLVLTPGKFFIGMNETDASISLGTTPFNFAPNSGWIIFANNPWLPSENYGFSVTYLLRGNFGEVALPTANAGLAGQSIACTNGMALDLFPALGGSPDTGGTWTDNNSTGALMGSTVDPTATGVGTFTFTYLVTDMCGNSDSTTVTLTVENAPNAGPDQTQYACDFQAPFDLNINHINADTGGTWVDNSSSGALSGSTFAPQTAGPGNYTLSYIVSSANCGSDTATVTLIVSVCPAIDPVVELSFQLYPNPNQGQFHLEVPSAVGQNLEIRVIDLLGKEVYSSAIENASSLISIDLGDVVPGVYIIELNNGETRQQGRLIKE